MDYWRAQVPFGSADGQSSRRKAGVNPQRDTVSAKSQVGPHPPAASAASRPIFFLNRADVVQPALYCAALVGSAGQTAVSIVHQLRCPLRRVKPHNHYSANDLWVRYRTDIKLSSNCNSRKLMGHRAQMERALKKISEQEQAR